MHSLEDRFILPVFAALIPKPVDHQLFAGAGMAKGKAVRQIAFKGNGEIIGLKSVEGDVDFMQRGGGKQHFLLLFQQGAVGGQDDLEALRPGKLKKPFQSGVQQRLSHQVKIQKVRVGTQFEKKNGKFFLRHGPFCPLGAGAKPAA